MRLLLILKDMSTHGGEAAWQVDGCDGSNNPYDLSTMCRALNDLLKLLGDAARFFREHFDLVDEFGCLLAAVIRQSAIDLGNSRCLRPWLSIGTS